MTIEKRDHGMDWEDIIAYEKVIDAIAMKYSGNKTLAEDVAQEVRLRLYSDKKLDISKFDPNKRDAAIRNTIRNKTIKVLKSRKVGRWRYESLDGLVSRGYQIDTDSRITHPQKLVTRTYDHPNLYTDDEE